MLALLHGCLHALDLLLLHFVLFHEIIYLRSQWLGHLKAFVKLLLKIIFLFDDFVVLFERLNLKLLVRLLKVR